MSVARDAKAQSIDAYRKQLHAHELKEFKRIAAMGFLPRELEQTIPEYFMLVDTGANIHIFWDDVCMAYKTASHRSLSWGAGIDYCVATGQLCGCVWILNTTSNAWSFVMIHSGQPNTAWEMPMCKRPLFSEPLARKQGHIIEVGSRAGLRLFGGDRFIPFIHDEPGHFMLLPMYPPPSRSVQFYQPSYQQNIEVVNMNTQVDDGTFDPESVRAWASPAIAQSQKRASKRKAVADSQSPSSKRHRSKVKSDEPVTGKRNKGISSTPVLGGNYRARKQFSDAARAFDYVHAKLGHHGSMKRLIRYKRDGMVISSQLPPKFTRPLHRNCKICLAMKKRRRRRPKAISPEAKKGLTPWEMVQADTSGKFKVTSKLGNRYYSAFTCVATGVRVAIPHAKRKHFPLVYLKFVQRVQRHPRVIITDLGGENTSRHLENLWLAKEVLHLPVPKGEHHSLGSAEKAIGDLDQIQRGLTAEANAPSNVWDILTEHATLIDAMVNPSPSRPSMTKFEHLYGIKPNLDLLPKVGCFCVRLQEKSDRYDQKLDPLNLPGTFLGFATVRGCYGSVILTSKGTLISARHNVAYDEELMPRHDISSTNPRMRALQWLIGRGPGHQHSVGPFETDRTESNPLTMVSNRDGSSSGMHTLDEKVSNRSKPDSNFDSASSSDDEVHEVMSQIEPRSALDVPAFSIYPPAKRPIDIMTVPLSLQSGSSSNAPGDTRKRQNASAKPIRLRRSNRVAVRFGAKLVWPRRKSSGFQQIMSDFRNESAPNGISKLIEDKRKKLDSLVNSLVRRSSGTSANHAARSFKQKCGLSSRVTEHQIEANRSVLVGRKVMRFFPGFGGYLGTVKRYLPKRQVYELEFADGSAEYLPYGDILLLLRKSKRRREAEANYAAVSEFMMQAVFEAHAANGPTDYTEPADIFKAWNSPDHVKWREAIDKEMRLLGQEMDCWEEVDLSSMPKGHTLIDSTWIFKIKMKADEHGNMVYDKHRARLVAKGFMQRKGIDYQHSFSPTVSYVTLRFIMALTAMPGFISLDLDATCAFISARLPPEEQVYMKAIPGFPLPEGRCLKLKSSIYGLVQAPRAYFLLCKEVYTKCGFTQLKSDECVFIRCRQNIKGGAELNPEDIISHGLFEATNQTVPLEQRVYPDCPHSIAVTIICMYVDNNGVRTNARSMVDEFLAAVKVDGRILLNLEGDMSWFLSMRYITDPVTGAIIADQHPYIVTLLKKWGMEHCNSAQLPMKPTQDLAKLPLPARPDPHWVSQFCMLIGELMFLSTNSVPTISHAVHAHARYMTNATKAHLDSAKCILRYLKGFVDSGRKIRWSALAVRYPDEPGRVKAFGDSSWADVTPSRKSTYGYYLFVNNAAFAWKAALAPILALSTAEAELIAICACATEILYVRKLANELGFLQTKPTILYTDNQGAKALAEHTHFKGRSKHYQLRWTFIQDAVAAHQLKILHCPRDDMLADLQTAPRPHPVTERFSKTIYGEVFSAWASLARSSEQGGVA